MLIAPTLEQKAEQRMREWGKWSARGGWLGYPSVTILGRLIRQGPGASQVGRSPTELPEEVAETDAAVSQLTPILKFVCIEQYCGHGDLPSQDKRLELSREAFKSKLEYALKKVGRILGL